MSLLRRCRWQTLVLVCALVVAPPAVAQTPLGTAFTYQGRLLDGGSPAGGVYDLRFTLHATAVGSGPIAPAVALEDVPVSGGLFTVVLDFGATAFSGNVSWLEVAVRPGASTGAYTTVGLRQELTAAPNALFSLASRNAPWSGITAKPAGFADDVDNDSGGDITGVTAGAGLTGGGATGAVTVGVDFTGSSGSANASARSDHNHLGQAWTGTGAIALTIHNTGTALDVESSSATAVIGDSSATSGAANGVWGRSLSTNGRGVHGQSIAASGPAYGVYGTAASPDGRGVYGGHLATTGTEPAVMGETSSTSGGAVGVLGQVTPTTPGGNSAAVRGINNGTGALGIGVWGSQAGSGWGVNGTSVSGIGVRGAASSSAGVGVRATGVGPTGIALEIAGGAIRVAGAGEGTTTPVFVHVITTANSCNGSHTVFDHPLANGDPDAILIVTSRAPTGFRLWYGTICGIPDRWGLFASADFSTIAFARYNVMVVKP
jgi:hypothetical protein